MIGNYILNKNGKPQLCTDLMIWGRWMENNDTRIIAKNIKNEVTVSTVFLGIDHDFTHTGPPILFETMIFGGEHDQYQERYATKEQAELGHTKAWELVNGQ